MAEISALTPSPPGLGDPHTSPSLLHPSTPPPHTITPTDSPKQVPVPKSTLYGDPAVMGSPTLRTGGREPPGSPPHGRGPPLVPPKPPPSTSSEYSKSPVPPGEPEPGAGCKTGTIAPPALGQEDCNSQEGMVEVTSSQPKDPRCEMEAEVAGDEKYSGPEASAVTEEATTAQNPHPPQTPPPLYPEPPGTPRIEPGPPIPHVQEPVPAFSLPHHRPAPDTLSYLESASLMSGTLESLSGLGEDGSSLGSDSEVNGMVLRRTDKYGFLGGAQFSEGSEKDLRVDVARQREMKWLEMFCNWDKWISRRFQKVKLRCRKGIPSSLRAKAWQHLSNSTELLELNAGKQQDLFRILKAYTVYRPDEGYCQAQAPVAAVLLMHMPAEEAIQLDGEIFFALLRRVCPMAYRHLKKFKIDPILYMTEWFMCIFSRTLPWSCVLRVWDMFFCEGVKVVFRVGLVLLKQMLGSVNALTVTEALIERESTIQVRKWRESRGELTHQPGRRLHGTRAIHELKHRAAAISSGGSFSFLGGPAPAPGPLRASSSLLSLPGFRKSKAPFRLPAKKSSFSGSSGFEPIPVHNFPGQSSAQNPTHKPPSGLASKTQAPAKTPSTDSGPDPVPDQNPPAASTQREPDNPAKALVPPHTLSPSPKIVSEQITPTIPSPTANNTPLPPSLGKPKEGPSATATPAAEDEGGKKKKKSKEDKKKEKEEEKHKARERKEKDKAEKEKQKKEKKKEKGGKKKEKGGGGEVEEKNGGTGAKDSA
ncbi:hypothetical protein JZ751_015120 [Albula glossodonta]|uniref:Rab-GAP TBC domain-containing protein n=1 Tax=Albula glossodonta TaxID=121402 RepID=A0A8T2NRZ5_9TELE|nr:hypothetical protein JZ751_015120 [Albula glossodonta]